MKKELIALIIAAIFLIGMAEALTVSIGGTAKVNTNIAPNYFLAPSISGLPAERVIFTNNQFSIMTPYVAYSWVTPAMISTNNALVTIIYKTPTAAQYYPSLYFYKP